MNFCVVKRKPTFSSFIPLILVAVVSIVLAAIALTTFTIYLSILLLTIGAAVIVYMLPSVLKSEYEYSIEGEVFSVALIKNNTSRKEIFSCEMDYLISCAPYDEHDTNGVKNKINAYVDSKPLYCAVFTQEEQTAVVTFSPSEEFIKSMRLLAPLKVKVNIM